uniref:store-operated calcium entry regulator STIMATE isoform X1 n=1 Tax=Myxine glutinosa TaxID=7769 RepID=UPI00358F3BAB
MFVGLGQGGDRRAMSANVSGAANPQGCHNGDLMDTFGVFIQGLLAILAFSILMLKRFREPAGERRPWQIWFFDTSKQICGQLFIHFANVYLSNLTKDDPCSLYLVNFLLDATLGMLLIWLGIRLTSRIVEWRRWEWLQFGEYGDPPKCTPWAGQCGLYLLIVACEKCTTFLVMLVPIWSKVHALILSLIPNPQIELTLVMLIVPFIVNALMFWVTDNFLMKKSRVKVKQEGVGGSDVRYRRAATHDDSESEVLISPDDESEKCESDRDRDGHRLVANGTAGRKKKVRFEMPV